MKINAITLFAMMIVTIGCGSQSQSSSNNNNSQSLEGSWEAAAPNVLNDNLTEYVELNLLQSGTSLSAPQIAVFFFSSTDLNYAYCTSPAPTFSGTVDGTSISGTVTDCYGSITFSGTVANNNSITGTFKSSAGCGPSGGYCTSGTFSAQRVTALSGSYAGQLTFEDGTLENVSVSVTANASGTATVTGSVSGADAGSISLSGTVVGNAAAVQGTVSGQSLSLYAWGHNGSVYIVDQNTAHYYGTLNKQ